MSLELAAQVGALLGTSAIIYLATQPSHHEHPDALVPQDLRGMKRYSSYHRKSYYARQQSSFSANNNSSSNGSVASEQSSCSY